MRYELIRLSKLHKHFIFSSQPFFQFFARYRLCAIIHHRYTPIRHFTTTLVGRDGQLYLYDDLKKMIKVQTSTDSPIYGIYSRIYPFDD